MPFFTSPTSYRLNSGIVSSPPKAYAMTDMSSLGRGGWLAGVMPTAAPHSAHPDFGHLVLLVFEAVLEVVCVSLPGYIVARQGMFDAEAQKFVANLNVQLFTPCLSKSTLSHRFRAALTEASPQSLPSWLRSSPRTSSASSRSYLSSSSFKRSFLTSAPSPSRAFSGSSSDLRILSLRWV